MSQQQDNGASRPGVTVARTPTRNGTAVLALNAGSSSLKFALFPVAASLNRVHWGEVKRIGLAGAELTLGAGTPPAVRKERVAAPDHAKALDLVVQQVGEAGGTGSLAAVGHRVLHGGQHYSAPRLISTPMTAELWRLSPLGPEHLPAEITLIEAIGARFPGLPQVACFDTAFHRDLPPVARRLPLPGRYAAAGVRRYGFHGLSYEFLMEELVRMGDAAAATGRVILAHLGHGASMAAVRDGRCIDTSMAFTPAAGLVMGSRSGDLDPGLPAYLARTEGMTAEQFDKMVNHESGLLGVSGISSDMRELLGLEKSDPRAAEAIALFCYQARKWLGAFAAALGGLDTLVFSGGIGENSPDIRARICDGLDFLGLELNEARNGKNATLISNDASRVAVRVIRTDEEWMIARSTCRVLGLAARAGRIEP